MSSWEEDRIDELWDEIHYLDRKMDDLEEENSWLIKTNSKLNKRKKEYINMNRGIDSAVKELKLCGSKIDKSYEQYKKGYTSETAQKKNKTFSQSKEETTNVIKDLIKVKEDSLRDIKKIENDEKKNNDIIASNKREIQRSREQRQWKRDEIYELESML